MLKIALLGLGGIGRHLATEVVDHPDASLEAVVDVAPENLAAAAEFGVDESARYIDETAMYENSTLDAVVVATPPVFHHRQIRDAFSRGLHVLCEKPVVVDREEARGVVDLFDSSSQVLMACYQRHLDPAYHRASDRWRGGELEPTFVTGELTQDWTHHFESGENWRTDPEIGARGHLFSVGTHVLESILWTTGLTPESVVAEMSFYDDDERIDVQSSLSIRFDNGAVASVSDSALVPAQRERLRIWDDEGAVEVNARDWGRPTLTLLDEEGDESTVDLSDERRRTKVEAIETGSKPPATAEDALRVTALLDAAYESARTGQRVAVDLE